MDVINKNVKNMNTQEYHIKQKVESVHTYASNKNIAFVSTSFYIY